MKVAPKILLVAAMVLALMYCTAYAGPRVTVIGDSYSAFSTTSTGPGGLPYDHKRSSSQTYQYYFVPYYYSGQGGVSTAGDMWWAQVIASLGGRLEVCNAISGSAVSRGYNDGNERYPMIRSERLEDDMLGDPDLILLFGGTNDSWNNVGLGDTVDAFAPENWTEANLKTFRPAFAYLVNYLKVHRPSAQIMVVINTASEVGGQPNIKASFAAAMEEIAAHYQVGSVRLYDIDKSSNHPTAAGMTSIAEQVVAAYRAYYPEADDAGLEMTLNGSTLAVTIAAGAVAESSSLVLAWGNADGGREINAWEHVAVLASSVGASGGYYEVDGDSLGILPNMRVRAFLTPQYDLLDYLKTSTAASDCQRFVWPREFGKTSAFDIDFEIGSTVTSDGVMLLGGSSYTWSYNVLLVHNASTLAYISNASVATPATNTRYRLVSNCTSSQNFSYTLSGGATAPGTRSMSSSSSPLSALALPYARGTTASQNRSALGYKLYSLKIKDGIGDAAETTIDCVPARRADGTVGLFDRAAGSFKYPLGQAALEQGTKTNTMALTSVVRAATSSLTYAVAGDRVIATVQGVSARADGEGYSCSVVVAYPTDGSAEVTWAWHGELEDFSHSEPQVFTEIGVYTNAVRVQSGGLTPFYGLAEVVLHGINLSEECSLAEVPSQTATGEVIHPTPAVTLKATGEPLSPGVDFEYVYSPGCSDPGVYTVTARAIGTAVGELSTTFTLLSYDEHDADTYFLTATDGKNTSSLDWRGQNWRNGTSTITTRTPANPESLQFVIPVALNARSPTAGDFTFAGKSLTVCGAGVSSGNKDGSVGILTTGTVTFPDLRLQGGQLRLSTQGALKVSGRICLVAGYESGISKDTTETDARSLEFTSNSVLCGGGTLAVYALLNANQVLTFSGDDAAFCGAALFTHRTPVVFNGEDSWFGDCASFDQKGFEMSAGGTIAFNESVSRLVPNRGFTFGGATTITIADGKSVRWSGPIVATAAVSMTGGGVIRIATEDFLKAGTDFDFGTVSVVLEGDRIDAKGVYFATVPRSLSAFEVEWEERSWRSSFRCSTVVPLLRFPPQTTISVDDFALAIKVKGVDRTKDFEPVVTTNEQGETVFGIRRLPIKGLIISFK